MSADLADAELLIAGRRSSLVMDRERAVDGALVERLLALVAMAPNHKRTSPWRVAAFTGEARAELGEAFCIDCGAAGLAEAKLDKIRAKYLRAPTVVVVGCAPSDHATRHREDLFACAAGVQNLLLGATAAGLVTLWSSPPAIHAAAVGALAGFSPGTELVAVVYVGHPGATG